MIKIGVTGGIGSGKTTVCSIFKKFGAIVLDSDKIVSYLLKKGELGYKNVISLFGEEILDEEKNIDKKKLAKIVFEDDEKRKNLEKILHPLVIQKRREIFRSIEKILEKDDLVVCEAALIFEAKTEKEFDYILLIKCDEKERIKRLKKRGLNEEEIEKRMKVQLPDEEKEKIAHFIIENSGNLKEVEKEVKKIVKEIKKNV